MFLSSETLLIHISVSSPAKEATQIVGAARVAEIPGAALVVKEAAEKAARVAETSGAAPVVKEAAENAVGVSYIVGAARVAKTPGKASGS